MISIYYMTFRNRTPSQCILVMLFVFLFFRIIIKKENNWKTILSSFVISNETQFQSVELMMAPEIQT